MGDGASGYVIPASLLAAVAIGFIAVSGSSLWIDEFATLRISGADTAGAAIQALLTVEGSDSQMPLYVVYLWAWIQLFGDGEWTIRAANVPFFVAGLLALVYWIRRTRGSGPVLVVVLGCLSPFLWYYLNEARPYVMQFAGGAMFLGGVVAALLARPEDPLGLTRHDCALLGIGAIILCGSSLLGVPWLASGAIVLALTWRRGALVVRGTCRNSLIWTAGALLALGAYFLWTVARGASPFATEPRFALSLGFALYELLGFSGIGPGRLALREAGPAALEPWMLGLGLYGALWATVLLLGWRQRRKTGQRARVELPAIIILIGLPIVFLAVLSQVRDFRVLGRHLAPLEAIILLSMAVWLDPLLRARRVRGWWLLVPALASLLASSLSLRVAPRHRRDDYRSAAAAAVEGLQSGRSVWWVASLEGAVYYGLPLKSPIRVSPGVFVSESGVELRHLSGASTEAASELPRPDLIVLSKPDVYDPLDAVGQVTRSGYRLTREFQAFKVFARVESRRGDTPGPGSRP